MQFFSTLFYKIYVGFIYFFLSVYFFLQFIFLNSCLHVVIITFFKQWIIRYLEAFYILVSEAWFINSFSFFAGLVVEYQFFKCAFLLTEVMKTIETQTFVLWRSRIYLAVNAAKAQSLPTWAAFHSTYSSAYRQGFMSSCLPWVLRPHSLRNSQWRACQRKWTSQFLNVCSSRKKHPVVFTKIILD